MNYEQARAYIKDLGRLGSIPGLATITELMERLGNPQKKIRLVHVAGTNGKGSVIAYLDSILRTAGFHVGKYTSPAVFSPLEIICVDGRRITADDYAACVTAVKEAADEMAKDGGPVPTAFETNTAAAYLYFAGKNCDIALIETGMGGALDATNVDGRVVLSVITPVSLDHTDFLGRTVTEIARHKAGIIKDGCPVIAGRQSAEALKVISEIAGERRARMIVTGQVTNIRVKEDGGTTFDYVSAGDPSNGISRRKFSLNTGLSGIFQPENAATATEAALELERQGFVAEERKKRQASGTPESAGNPEYDALLRAGGQESDPPQRAGGQESDAPESVGRQEFNITESIVRGIKDAFIPGRMEKILDSPPFYIDGAHNPGAARALRRTLEYCFTNRRITYIMGVLADKDYEQTARITAPLASLVITVPTFGPRGLSAGRLKDAAGPFNPAVFAADSLAEAVDMAVESVENNNSDMILAFGSFTFLSELKEIVHRL